MGAAAFVPRSLTAIPARHVLSCMDPYGVVLAFR